MNPYETARNIARIFIIGLQKEQSLTQEDIRNQVGLACQSPIANGLTNDEQEKLIRELETDYQTVIGAERELIGDDEGWEPWLPQRRGSIDWAYWMRYQKYLAQESFTPDVLARLESSTDRVIGLLGDPNREGSWDRRGLVVGLVQSGKTAHYVGTINKAVDAGYKVIVILTGFTESLRTQTQDRIEQGVLGYSLSPDLGASPCGVDHIAPLRPRIDSVTTLDNDFRTAIAQNFAIQVGGNPIVFVIKKNATVLKNLLNWVTNFGTDTDADGRRYVKDVPLLVIDDESDVGSVDTKKGGIDHLGDADEDHDPTKLNKQIRKLLSLFDQSSYMGYTATPFANVLIHDLLQAGIDKEDGLKIGEDLFPRSFIVSLPTPSNHIGPSMIFGSSQDSGSPVEGLPIIREVNDVEKGEEKADYWMPASHRSSHIPLYLGQDRIPESLQEALYSFILVCAARRLRGDHNKHNSMLIHVTRFNDVQQRVYDQIERELIDIVNRIRNNATAPGLFEILRNLWEEGNNSYVETTRSLNQRPEAIFHNPVHTWTKMKGELLEAASSIQVRAINGKAGEVLDYKTHAGGLNVIAIGGDKLARGLTLEGLSISYFLRCSKMYDTLMQMGRWFGYRPGYVDLCRLYTTDELCDWFTHIAEATEELRGEFELMANAGRTPKDFGLRVRSHPQMMVTSSVKMQHGQEIQVSFQGTQVQTIDFSRKKEAVKKNWDAAKNLIKALESGSGTRSKPGRSVDNSAMWVNVPSNLIEGFLAQYTEHKAARKVKTDPLKEYIEKQNVKKNLTTWTVLLSGGGSEKYNAKLPGVTVKCVERGWFTQGTSDDTLKKEDHYRIKVLIDPPDEDAGLNDNQIAEALQLDIADWNNHQTTRKKPTAPPGGRFLRQVRDEKEGLLILYPLSPDKEKAEQDDYPILGFVISFPQVAAMGDTMVSYVIGNIYQQEMNAE
jgi:hypothetical protein